MAVPAHVRNDFQSHLMFADVNSINFTKWYYNLFENYVLKNDSMINQNIGAIRPTISAGGQYGVRHESVVIDTLPEV